MNKHIAIKIMNYTGIQGNLPVSPDQLWQTLQDHPTGKKFLALNRISTMD